MTAGLKLCDLSVGYPRSSGVGQSADIIHALNASFRVGEITCLFGANGSGKTTLLRSIARLIEPRSGGLVYDDTLPSHISYMPQDYRSAIFPWLTVDQNIDFNGRPNGDISERAIEIRRLFLPELGGEEPVYALSGGQLQLVCLARALCATAGIVLLDEPLSAVDAVRSLRVLEIVGSIWDISNILVIWVTHSIDEGIMAGDRILLLEMHGSTQCREVANPTPKPRSVEALIGDEPNRIRREIIASLKEA